MQVTTTVYDVALAGVVIGSFTDRGEADGCRGANPGAQVRTRARTDTLPAAFAVFVSGTQVGDPHTDPGAAAKAAKKLGGMIRMVPLAVPI